MVQPRTISNCFRHTDFRRIDTSTDATEATSEIDDDPEDDIPLARLAQLGLTTTTLQDYMIVDDSLPTSERLTDDDIIYDIISNRYTDYLDADNADDNYTDRPEIELPTSLSKAIDACAKLRNYFEQCDNSDDFLTSLGHMTNVLMKQDFKKRCARQTLITRFFEGRDTQ